MVWLTWIKDEDLIHEVSILLNAAINAKKQAINQFGKNVIDPFAALFEVSGFNMTYDVWLESERSRQAQKTLQNHIGEFHQNILGNCRTDFHKKPGWLNMKVGNVIDLVSENQNAIAEIKNKHNTISGGKLVDLYETFEKLITPKSSIYKGYTAYYVAIVPKKSERYNRPFTPSNNKTGERCPINEQIREIDGASFYSLVTGSNTALKDLYRILPEVINNCTKGKYSIPCVGDLKNLFEKAYK